MTVAVEVSAGASEAAEPPLNNNELGRLEDGDVCALGMSREAERGKLVILSTSSSRNTSGRSSSRLGSGRGAKRIFLVCGAD